MGVVVDQQIPGDPDTIGILGSAVRVQRHSTVTGERGMNDTVAKSKGTIGDGQGAEERGVFTADVVDSHGYGFVQNFRTECNAEQGCSNKVVEPALIQASGAIKYVNSVNVIRVY